RRDDLNPARRGNAERDAHFSRFPAIGEEHLVHTSEVDDGRNRHGGGVRIEPAVDRRLRKTSGLERVTRVWNLDFDLERPRFRIDGRIDSDHRSLDGARPRGCIHRDSLAGVYLWGVTLGYGQAEFERAVDDEPKELGSGTNQRPFGDNA